MLEIQKHLFLFFSLLMFSFYGIAQNSASASFTASVKIVEPISVQTTENMNFASIDARNGGSVILNPDHTREAIGGVLLDNASNVSAAVFEVKGQNGYSYNIDLPEGSFRMVNGANEIVVKDFEMSTSSATLNSDSQVISLGATLYIEPGQKPGIYSTPSPIEIMVSYN
ncbi:DUF4402 domain-containing protein [Gramella sp. MAR_2010_147]|uniref:DUF4402 domain-containing protein n=1 Tax=Gramella sp. MAR_2010_147 TaxID=1250205 RepID=UPI0012FD99A0|nr:DUF4402 domain-containing protein [Gramella sp. MAR_2010_147]